MSHELWQLYDEQGRALAGKGTTKDDAFAKGLLHAASHVWIWRINKGVCEVLLQKRAAAKRTWPNRYDISAAGHIDIGEDAVTAALREAQEEIGLDLVEDELTHIGVHRAYIVDANKAVENEFQYLYLYHMPTEYDFKLETAEVGSIEWRALDSLKASLAETPDSFVPHGERYYRTVLAAIEAQYQTF